MVAALIADFSNAPVSDAERVLLKFATKLTRALPDCQQADIEALRGAGWSDRAILDATLVAAYFAFVNRVAEGLGVELESRAGRGRD